MLEDAETPKLKRSKKENTATDLFPDVYYFCKMKRKEVKGQISYCHKLTLRQVAEEIQEVAELKDDYDVLKEIKGVDPLAKEFQVHDTCKREYLRCYSSNTSTYRDGNENTAMNSEGRDFEAVKKCLCEKVLDLN